MQASSGACSVATRQTLSLDIKALAAVGVLSFGRIVIESEQGPSPLC